MRKTLVWEQFNGIDENLPEEAMISTPIGLFKANSKTPLNQFDFWILHSNFSFSKSDCSTIDSTTGVETQTLISPFKNLISIGSLFEVEKIKQLLELRLLGRILNNISEENVPEELIRSMDNKYSSILFPNGYVLEITEEDYHDDVKSAKRTAELVGGIFRDRSVT